MPVSNPCSTAECQQAALAAMRAGQKDEGAEPQGPTMIEHLPGKVAAGGGLISALTTGAGGGGGNASPAASPATPGTPGGGVTSPLSLVSPGSGEESPGGAAGGAKAVRFSDDTARDNLHVALPSGMPTSRSSSVDSLHREYDAAVAHRKPPPATSGFHVVLTAGGRLEAVSSSARWEDVVGYSRAVKRGPFIFVSGTSAVDQATGRVMYRRDAYKQTRLAFTIVERALEQVGATIEDVVRTRLFVRNMQRDGECISKAHGEVLGHVKPASTMVEVSRLVHEDILVLIEVDAITESP